MSRPPIIREDEGQPGYVGARRSRIASQKSLRLIHDGTLGPVWQLVKIGKKQRDTLEHWGVAEFRERGQFRGIKTASRCDTEIVLGRLTPEGVRIRDHYHRRSAERRANAERRRKKRKK